MLDIVIPTLNEEGFVGALLTSLAKQTYKDFHVYLSDGGSTDNTTAVAEKFTSSFPLTIHVCKKRGVSHQRNEGAKLGKSTAILFLDADVVVHPNFLLTLLKELKGKELANCWIHPLSKKPIDKVFYRTYNFIALEVGKYIWPFGIGVNLYSTRELYNKLNGFDESLTFWEDVDYTRRAIKLGATFAILRKPKLYVSTRRLEVEGRISLMLEALKGLIYAIRTGEMPTEEQISYPMNLDYSKLLTEKSYSQRQLSHLLNQYTKYMKLLREMRALSMRKYLHGATVKKISSFFTTNRSK